MSHYKTYPEILQTIPDVYIEFTQALCEVGKEIDNIFVSQIDKKRGVYAEKTENRLKNDYIPDRFSVTVSRNAEVIEIPYTEYFKEHFANVIVSLQNARKSLKNLSNEYFPVTWWENYLQVIEQACKDNSWDTVETVFLSTPATSPFLLSIGPIERYHDKVKGVKRFFSFWFLYTSEAEKKYESLWSELIALTKEHEHFIPFYRSSQLVPTLFIGNMICESGEVSKITATGWSRPEDPEIAKKHGSIKTIAANKFQKKVAKLQHEIALYIKKWPTFSSVSKPLQEYYEELPFLSLVAHEFGHTFLKADQAAKNLGPYYTFIEESRAEINMLYLCLQLEERKKIPEGTTQMIFLSEVLLFPYAYYETKETGHREEYLYSQTLWIYMAIRYGMLTVSSGEIRLSHLNGFKDMIIELKTMLNTIAFFGSHEINVYAYKMFISSYTHELAAELSL